MGTNRRPHSHRVLRDDLVKVIAGEEKGQIGRVLRVIPEKSRVVVEGVNLVYRHIRRSQQNPQGGRVRREAPIHISNVMVLDSDGETVTRVGRRRTAEGKGSRDWERFAKKSGEVIGQIAKPKKDKAKKKAGKSKE
jgi:large subunit ribosomal protein L24